MADPPKYSIITICKGRLHHIVRSVPAMLQQHSAEVVVVDYDCPDKTADYVSANFPSVKVVRVVNAPGFNPSQARNYGARDATGNVFVFVDADVIIAPGFTRYLDEHLGPNTFGKFPEAKVVSQNSLQGTCAIHRNHFWEVGGYDEVLKDYGAEDSKLYDRLKYARVEQIFLAERNVSEVISHSAEERARFFQLAPDTGFLIGKVYRIAKNAMMRMQDDPHVSEPVRRSMYAEVTRLVGNMDKSDGTLSLEIRFPDNGRRGLHAIWEFTFSVVIKVNPR